jgi:hypothetical protein
MPVRVGNKDKWQMVKPTADWQTMPTSLSKDKFDDATELYYVNVSKE